MRVLLALLDPKALEDILRNPFLYKDENWWPPAPFSLALDASDGSHLVSSISLSQVWVGNIPQTEKTLPGDP